MWLKTYKNTFLGCLLMFLLTGFPHLGFILIVYAPFIFGICVWNGIKLLRKKGNTQILLKKTGIWLLCATLIVISHILRHFEVRKEANFVVNEIQEFYKNHARYPESIEEIDISVNELKEKLGRSFYSNNDGEPIFVYGVTYIIYDTYSYDFVAGKWDYKSS